MADLPAEVAAFFDSYRRAFERYDVEAIAGHFAFPTHITGDAAVVSVRAVPAREDWIPQLDRLLGMYRTLGVHSARLRESSANRLSDQVILATARWALADAAGRPLYEFNAAYTLARIDGMLRSVAIAHDEFPRYQAALARLRPGGYDPGGQRPGIPPGG